MKKACHTFKSLRGFSLPEVLAAVMIGAMVLIAVLSVYGRAERSAAAVIRKLDSYRLPAEVLQRIAEDLDRITAPGTDTKITIKSKFENNYQTSRLEIRKTISDNRDKQQTFEEIIWQASYSYESDANGLVLYRSHRGIALEDKLLDEERDSLEKEYSFVPICTGVTFFKVQVPKGEDILLDAWTGNSLPPGVIVTVSFAEPFEALDGRFDVPQEEKIGRTMAVDRTRKIPFKIVKEALEEQAAEQEKEDGETEEELQGSRKEKETDSDRITGPADATKKGPGDRITRPRGKIRTPAGDNRRQNKYRRTKRDE